MGQRSHLEQLEEAVRVAREAVHAGHAGPPGASEADDGPGPLLLSRHLYQRWYLGRSVLLDSTPPRPWQAWSPLWRPWMDELGSDLVRLNLSVDPATALHAIATVTRRAVSWQHPWRLDSVLPGPTPAGGAPVPESTVLYVPMPALFVLRREIRTLVKELYPFLTPDVSALTLRIGRGASLAQNPDNGSSFGQHRCALVAGAVLTTMRCHQREQVDRTREAFARAGVDPARPYLEQRTSWDRPWRAA